MRLQDVMSRKVETVDVRAPADTAWNVMKLKKIHHLVVTSDAKVVGVVSERDLGGVDRDLFRRTKQVLDVMTAHAVTAAPETPLRKAANLMRGWSIGCLPVMRNGKLVGIVTVSDLLALLGKGLERPVMRTKGWILKRRVPHRPPAGRRAVS